MATKKRKARATVTLNLDPESLASARQAADAEEISLSAFLRRLIKRNVQRPEATA